MPRRVKVCQKAISSVVEALERRVMLTTLMGGGVDPFTGEPLTTTFVYKDALNHRIRITIGGNTTAEFIGVAVPAAMGGPGGGPPNVPEATNLAPFGGTMDGQGIDLFHIYVSESDASSFIAVNEIAENGQNMPFNGNAGTFRVNRNDGLNTITPDGGTGVVLLGAVTKDVNPNTTDEQDVPIVSIPNPGAFGVRPDTGRRLSAGFQVAPGHDFGKFFLGGTIFGVVNISQSIDSFYAGNLWTGDARGVIIGGGFATRRSMNFVVGGNLHSLLVKGSIGTNNDGGLDDPVYTTDFDMQVTGILGQINARDSIIGGVNVVHGPVAPTTFGANVEEVEGRSAFSNPNQPSAGWSRGLLEGDAAVFNDSFDTPQVLPSFTGRRGRSEVVVNGQLMATTRIQDYVDYYAMPLLAGQAMQAQISLTGFLAGLTGELQIGIFDPDGRLVATDFELVNINADNLPVRYVADRPGLYRIAVAPRNDRDFNGTGGEFGTSNVGNVTYQLVISQAGDVALGGVVAGNNIYDGQAFGYGYYVQNGDFGSLEAGGAIFSAFTDQSVVVRRGSLRSLSGGRVGLLNMNGIDVQAGMDFDIQRGNVGLVRSTTGDLVINQISQVPVGGDYQVISSADNVGGNFIAARGIGVIRGASMTERPAPNIIVNADQVGADGIIDLIDVAGDLGRSDTGGPAIITGPGGDVRYMHVGGVVWRDPFFGGSQPEATTYAPGETVHLVDDSGAKIDLEPFPLVSNPLFIPGGTNPALIGPQLTVTAYGIEGSGGVAVINVTSTGSVRVGGGGGRGSKSHVEIGQITSTGIGNPVVRSTNTGQLVFAFPTGTFATNARNLDVLINGSAKVDVYDIQGSDFTSIRNQTPGEIVNINSTINPTLPPAPFTNNGTIGSLEGTNIGIAEHHTPAVLGGQNILLNTFPYLQQRTGIISGNVLNVQAAGAIGNLSVTGDIGNITANSGGRHTTGGFEGIAGPIVASGNVATVDIGDGILPSGSGNLGQAGLYVGGRLEAVTNRGLGSDIRGSIISNSSIGSISLRDGAIIGSKIMIVTNFAMSRRFVFGVVIPGVVQNVNNPFFDIGSISMGGRGGIIGSDIRAANMGPVTVSRGFGIFGSEFGTLGDGRIGAIYAEGYGLRGDFFIGGASLTSLTANAKNRNVSVLNYTPSVRFSERYAFDPFFNTPPNIETDLHAYLGTSARKPRLKRITDMGVIEDVSATGSRDLGSVRANQIRGSTATSFTQLNFANSIGTIRVGTVDGLSLTTGRLKTFVAGSNVVNFSGTVAGTVESFRVVGDFDETSALRATGSSGHIGTFEVDGNLNGDVSSTGAFDLLVVGGDVGPSSLITAKSLGKKIIKGNIFGTIKIG
jgi:hypothetical protein